MDHPFPILKTNRLLLRQFIDTDLENVFKGLSHPNVIKYYGVSYRSLEATKAQMIFLMTLKIAAQVYGGQDARPTIKYFMVQQG